MKKKIIAAGILIIITLAAGLLLLPPVVSAPSPPPASEVQPEPEPEQPIELLISCVGDVMAHSTQYNAQYDSQTETYDFNDNYQYVSSYIKEADLALVNLETVFGGGRPQGYPSFNAPDSLANALKNAGFDVALISNNHILDRGTKGLDRTLDVVRGVGMETAGAHKDGEEPYRIIIADGIKIGVISYTYETPAINGARTLNGNSIPASTLPRLNSFSFEKLDEDLLKIGEAIDKAKADGADIIVCYFHWGEEYQRAPNKWQIEMAQSVSDMGVDIIFGSHPHVVQPVDVLTDDVTGKETAVFYSMGNFISNQRSETLDNRYTEQGIIAEVKLTVMKSTGEIQEMDVSAIPVWVDRYKTDRTRYAIIPLDSTLTDNPALAESGHLERAQRALADLTELIGEDYLN